MAWSGRSLREKAKISNLALEAASCANAARAALMPLACLCTMCYHLLRTTYLVDQTCPGFRTHGEHRVVKLLASIPYLHLSERDDGRSRYNMIVGDR